MLRIIENRKIFLTISAIAVIAALAAIGVFRLRQGIDFSGGTLMTFSIKDERPGASLVQEALVNDLKLLDARVNYDAQNDQFLVRVKSLNEEEHQAVLKALEQKFPSLEEKSFQSIGPSVGEELRKKSLIAIVLVLIGISLYIAFAFRKVFRPVSSWKYGWITLITLGHDVVIPAGLLAILGKFSGVEIDGNFVVALLVIMGFSVHDTIVVFDRIRENLLLDRSKSDFGAVVNTSVNQTLSRSINTSLTLIFVLFALYVVGPLNLRFFVLTLLVGVTTGIYSSIFVASPLLYAWQRWSAKAS